MRSKLNNNFKYLDRTPRREQRPRARYRKRGLVFSRASIGLAAEECRDIELIVLRRIIHRRRAAVGIEPLRSSPTRIFRDRLRWPAFRLTSRRPLRRALVLRHGSGWTSCRGRRRRLRLRAPTQANRGKPLHERHAPLFRMIFAQLAPLRPNLVLRRQGQLVDAAP